MKPRRAHRHESWNEQLWFFRERLLGRMSGQKAREPAHSAFAHSLPCPKCSVAIHTIAFRGVEVEVCPSCDGIFLDKGEVDRLREE